MKIAYFLHTTDPTAGATKSILALIHGLVTHGEEAIVVVPDAKGIVSDLREKGVRVFVQRFRSGIYPGLKSFKDWLLFIPRLAYWRLLNHIATNALTPLLKRDGVNIIHSNSSVIDIGYNISRRLHVPHVYHIREYADLIGFHFYPDKPAFVRRFSADNSFAIFITKGLQSYFGQSGNPHTAVIYNAIHVDNSTTTLNLPHKQFFFYAGRIEKTKGIDLLLQAYDIYQRTVKAPLPLWLAGTIASAEYLEHLNLYIKSCNMQDKVRFLGVIDNVHNIMSHARATIIPSLNEGFGRCLSEAMLCRCLTIARNTTGSKEQMDNGLALQGTEIALRFETIEELAKHLCDVSEAPVSEYDEMCSLAFDTVSTLYSLQANYNNTLMLYQKILGI